MDINNLVTISTQKLSTFSYGVHNDNYLTYAMRLENRKIVQYLLSRGVSPLSADDEGKTAIHYAIEFQSLPMLCYLCEGWWDSKISSIIRKGMDPPQEIEITTTFPNWVYLSWKALDISATKERLLPLHFCAFIDSTYVLKYILYIAKLRTKVYGQNTEAMKLKEMLEFKSKNCLTPLLFAAQHAKGEIFEILLSAGSNMYEFTGKMQNVLHLAIINRSERIIKSICKADSEKCILKNQKDYRGRIPGQYDKKGEFKEILISIWEAINSENYGEIQIVVQAYRERFNEDPLMWRIEKNGNTPLHLAAQKGNLELIKLLVSLDANPNLLNNDSKTPLDLLLETNPSESKEKLIASFTHRSLAKDGSPKIVRRSSMNIKL